MIDMSTAEGRVVSAALRVAAEKPWEDVTLRHVAESAGMNLAELSDCFASKSAILAAFVRHIDKQVLANAPVPQDGESQRDALFEVIMARFDVLEPYKSALRSVVGSGEVELSMIRRVLASQGWMLQAAGIDADGPAGAMRTAGLASVYASVFRTWLDDDDPGLARTMATLDRRLRSGETAMMGLDSAFRAVQRLKKMVRSGFGSASYSRSNMKDEEGQGGGASANSDEPPGAAPAAL